MMSFFIQCPSNTVRAHQEEDAARVRAWIAEAKLKESDLGEQRNDSARSVALHQGGIGAARDKLSAIRKKKKTKENKQKEQDLAAELEILLHSEQFDLQKFERLDQQWQSIKHEIRGMQDELQAIETQIEETQASDFEMQLAQRISLDGTWQVALVQLIYPRSWYNIEEGRGNPSILHHIPSNYFEVTPKTGQKMYFRVPPAFYDDPLALERALTDGLERMTQNEYGEWMSHPEKMEGDDWKVYFYWGFDRLKHRFGITVVDSVEEIRMGDGLKYILGFDLKKESFRAGAHTSTHPPDLKAGIESLYVYCDIVEPILIGNIRAPLLRTVGVTGNSGDVVDATFPDPHYLPVASKQFSSLRISINRDDGKPMRFKFGKVICKLHFRKVR